MKSVLHFAVFCLFLTINVTYAQLTNIDTRPLRPERTMNRGNWVGKRLLTKEFMEKIGIQGEQAKKLKADLEEVQDQAKKLEEAINQDALRQAELAKKILSQPGASADEITAIIEKIGQARIEQAKLATRQLLIIRDSLTADQREKAHALLSTEYQRRRADRAKERAAREQREEHQPASTP